MIARPQTFEELALAEPGRWELHAGEVREKPGMSFDHNDTAFMLGHRLAQQLDLARYRVRVNMGHVHAAGGNYFIPDVFVLPVELGAPFRGRPGVLEAYDAPLPLVVEIWSPSTGGYDAAAKLPTYQARGDAEIWFIHPYERTVAVWRRQPDGSYTEAIVREGRLRPVALPGVVIDLDELFGA